MVRLLPGTCASPLRVQGANVNASLHSCPGPCRKVKNLGDPSPGVQSILDSLLRELLIRGSQGVAELEESLRSLQYDPTRGLSRAELKEGFLNSGLKIRERDVEALFEFFTGNETFVLDLEQLLSRITAPFAQADGMSPEAIRVAWGDSLQERAAGSAAGTGILSGQKGRIVKTRAPPPSAAAKAARNGVRRGIMGHEHRTFDVKDDVGKLLRDPVPRASSRSTRFLLQSIRQDLGKLGLR